MMEVLVGLDDIAIEGGGGRVSCPLAELDELPVLHHGDGLPGELPRGHPLDGGGKLIEELEERTVARGHGIEAARVEAELAQPLRDHTVVLGLIARLPREGHLHLDVVGGHQPPRGDLRRLDLVLQSDLEEIEQGQLALDLGLERRVRIEPLEHGLVLRLEVADELLGRHAATPLVRSSGSSWVKVSLVTTRVQRPWSGWVVRASTWVVKPSTGGRGRLVTSRALKKDS